MLPCDFVRNSRQIHICVIYEVLFGKSALLPLVGLTIDGHIVRAGVSRLSLFGAEVVHGGSDSNAVANFEILHLRANFDNVAANLVADGFSEAARHHFGGMHDMDIRSARRYNIGLDYCIEGAAFGLRKVVTHFELVSLDQNQTFHKHSPISNLSFPPMKKQW